ncbi:hypothetical protein MMC17_004058 [Xylographa soralifera]|nr:hypothetical protein [Xylographa soralifera]
MNDFRVPTAEKPRLNLQAGGGAPLVPSPVDDMEYFYDSPPATQKDLLPLEKRSEDTIASLEADLSGPTCKLPGLDHSYSIAGSDYTTQIPIENQSGKQQASTNESPTHEITFALPKTIGRNGEGTSELRGLRSHATNLDKVDEVVLTGTVQCRSGTLDSGRGFGLLKTVKEVNRKINSTLDGVNGVEDIRGFLYLTQASSLSQKTSGISAPGVVRPSPSDPESGAAGSCESSDKGRRQPLLVPETPEGTIAGDTDFEDGTNATKNVLVQADKVNDDPQVEPSVLADGDLLVKEELKITENDMVSNLKYSVPEVTLTTAMPEEIYGVGAKGLESDLKEPSVTEAEFELDSSPYESSSDSSSNASSDDSSENDYEMLDPAEQARRLMLEDGGSEDEIGKKGTVNGPLRTLNEKPDEVVEKPNVIVTADMKIEELGNVETLVENLVLVKAKITGEYQVLDTGSVLCLQDRSVIGVVAETLGRVQQPLYSIRFTNANAIEQAGISKGTHIYYVPQYSTYVFTQTLKAFKGSDASNIHDEEVGDDELEFSDDEAEAEYKRNLKLHRQVRRGGRESASNGLSRAPRPTNLQKDALETKNSENAAISYDEISVDDDLYTPLARPLNLHEQMRQEETSSSSQRGAGYGGNSHGRNRGDSSRSRAGRGRGSRGRGWEQYRAGGFNASNTRQQPPNPQLDLSLPPMPPTTRPAFPIRPLHPPQLSPLPHSAVPPYSPTQQYQHHKYITGRSFRQHQISPRNGQASYSYPPQPPSPNYQPPYQHYPQHGQTPLQHYPSQPMNHYGQALTLHANGPHSLSNSAPPLPPGAFVNPAFFGNNYQQPANQHPFAPSHKGYPPHHNGYLDSQR